MSGAPDEKQKDSRVSPGRPPVRRKLQAEGELWVVHETDAPPLDRRGGTHLVFETEYAMRRVRFFPANWFELSDEELYALSCDIRQTD